MLRGHTRASKSVDDGDIQGLGVVGVLHSTRPKNQDKNLGRHLELSERLRVFARKKQRRKRAEEGHPHETQGRQGEVLAGRAHVRHV